MNQVTPTIDQDRKLAEIIDQIGVDLAATDTGAAKVFAALFKDRALHVAGLGWYVWKSNANSGQWVNDQAEVEIARLIEEMAAVYLIRAAEMVEDGNKDSANKLAKFALSIMNHGRKCAVLKEAQRHSDLARAQYPFDRDPWLLNTQSGVVDLKTGDLMPADPALMCSRMTAAAYDREAKAERWHRFLNEVFEAKQDVVTFVRRWLGYCLTGTNLEQKYLVAWGGGGNGKSTMFEAVLNVMGDYGTAIRPDVLAVRRDGGDTPTPALAEIVGRRLVVLPEWVRGKVIDEVLVKSIVGGDTVQGRKLYSQPFTFRSTAKLVIYGNAKPELRGRDWGTWRRVLLLPFRQQFGAGGRAAEDQLSERLSAERDGILADLVRAAVDWHAGGLCVPEEIKIETERYSDELDDVRAFVKHCVRRKDVKVNLRDLYRAYTEWGGELTDSRQLSRAIRDLGFELRRTAQGTVVLGLGLAATE